jgi:hypothetical protein
MRRHPFPALLVFFAVFAADWGVARAAPPNQREIAAARAAFAVGVDYADAGDWERAVLQFRRVIEVMPAPPVRFNLASALVELGRYPEAELLLEGIVQDPQSAAELRQASEAQLTQMRAEGGRVAFEPTAGEAVLVDGYAIGPDAFARGVLVRRGAHVVESYRDGRVVSRRRIEVFEGRDLRVTFAESGVAQATDGGDVERARDEAPSSRPARERPAWLRNKWVWIGVSAAAALGVGLGVGLAARNSRPFDGNFEPGKLQW